MLENYFMDAEGVIHQRKIKTPCVYDNNYVETRYNTYGELSNYMSYLRLGFLLGIIKYNPESILDIGYGNGDFLKICKKVIPKCAGYDISGYTVPEGCVYENNINNYYEVVTFFDALEHFEDLNIINRLNCKYIYISLPNCKYISDSWFKVWKHRREDEHLHHFNEISLKAFFLKYGYKPLITTCVEDIIRKDKEPFNILTGVFEKI
jgi:hypothetical protein